MFKSPIESYCAHHKIDIGLDYLLTAAGNTCVATTALKAGDFGVDRQKWESVHGIELARLWNIESNTPKHELLAWPEIDNLAQISSIDYT